MKIGDNVIFEDPLSETLYGIIINKEVPRCKCKGMGEWNIDFNGEIKKIKIGDKRLNLYNP
tara:strand:+ start:395 stop:577 length:183 start_codon:yes stop_codon:yes gene_type:complete